MATTLEPKSRSYYLTGDIANALDLSPKTVARLFDEGELSGAVIGGQRRITAESLQAYLRKQHLPWAKVPGLVCTILAVGVGHEFMRAVSALVPPVERVRCLNAETAFDAGTMLAFDRAQAIIVDTGIGRGEAVLICQRMPAETFSIAITSEDDAGRELKEAGYSQVIQRPAKPGAVAKALRQWLGV